jgi:hypothetical protein
MERLSVIALPSKRGGNPTQTAWIDLPSIARLRALLGNGDEVALR